MVIELLRLASGQWPADVAGATTERVPKLGPLYTEQMHPNREFRRRILKSRFTPLGVQWFLGSSVHKPSRPKLAAIKKSES